MKTAVIGAGAIGGFYGAALANAGMDVSFIARGKTLNAIRKHGLRLVGNTELTLNVPVTDDPTKIGQVDVVLLSKLQRLRAPTYQHLWAPTPSS